VRVDSDGSICFPLIGSVQAGGRTLTELSQGQRCEAERALPAGFSAVSVTVDKA
jgi:hypothetical protein